MAVTVSKNGPHFTSGAITWSDYRDKFKRATTGSVSASEMHRITSTSNTDPTMPDATENASVPTGGTIAASNIRNTIKSYNITVTGDNSQFNIGSQSWNSNYNKNIQKWTYLFGSYYSNSTGTPALRTGSTTYNNTLLVEGTVKAAGGAKGQSPSGNGGNGGHAIDVAGGNNIHIQLVAQSRVWGGGGGGGAGGPGISGAFGTCRKEYDIQGCGSLPACNQGGTGTLISSYTGDCCNKIRYCGGPWNSFCWHECWGDWNYGTCRFEANSTTPGVPVGGNGGQGQGNQQIRTNGFAGAPAVAPSCSGIGTMSGADMTLIGGSSSTSGGNGGQGGDWGQSGDIGGARNWVAVTSAGWASAGWMNNFAVYPSNNNTLSGVNHERTWDVYVSVQDAHRIDVRADNWAEILWDGASQGTLGNNTTFPFPAAYTNATVFNIVNPTVGWHTITARVFNGTGNYDWNTNPGGVAWVFKKSTAVAIIATSRSQHRQGGIGGSAGHAVTGSGYYVTGNNGTTVKGSI